MSAMRYTDMKFKKIKIKYINPNKKHIDNDNNNNEIIYIKRLVFLMQSNL